MRTWTLLETFWIRLRDVVGDAGVQANLDLAASLADRLRVVGLEQLGRQLAAGGLLAQHLQCSPGSVLARRLNDDEVLAKVIEGRSVLEVEAGPHLPASLVERVGQLGGVELGDHVEGVLGHCYCVLRMARSPITTATTASAIAASEEMARRAPMPAVASSSGSGGGLS